MIDRNEVEDMREEQENCNNREPDKALCDRCEEVDCEGRVTNKGEVAVSLMNRVEKASDMTTIEDALTEIANIVKEWRNAS